MSGSRFNSPAVPRDLHPWNAHTAVGHLVAPNSKVLDIGCGWGSVAHYLKPKGCHVTGVEPDPKRREVAAPHVDLLLDGVAEDLDRLGLEPETFDYVLFTDVLEHLVDPWSVLRESTRWLRPDGKVVLSIPNLANFGARWNLLRGRFRYEDGGLYDRTHLRFFVRSGVEELIAAGGLKPVAWHYTCNFTETRILRATLGRLPGMDRGLSRFDRALTYAWPTLFALQFVVVCERVVAPGGATTR